MNYFLFEARQTIALIHPELIEVGYMNVSRWRHIADTYADIGMLPRDFSLAGFLYDSNPQKDLTWFYRGLAVTLLLSIIVAVLVILIKSKLMNRKLEERVAAAKQTLAASFNERLALKISNAEASERERIYRDLHDDIGAKLLGLAISAQRADLPREADMARSALQDLRDVVSRSAQPVTALGDLVADWRAETEQRVQAAGIKLEWVLPAQEANIQVSADAALNLTRILREAVTNVLHHAGASHIRIVTQLTPDRFSLEVIDNGVGCPAADVKPRSGITGMQARAMSLSGRLNWGKIEPNGCKITLSVPLQGLPPPPPKHGG